MWIYDKQQVEALLDYPGCIAAMRDAMAALSRAGTAQPLRQIVPIGAGRLFGVMPGTLAEQTIFGAKMVSVFADPATGRSRHQGVVVVYDAGTGAVRCIADAEPVTLIRTAPVPASYTTTTPWWRDRPVAGSANTLTILAPKIVCSAKVPGMTPNNRPAPIGTICRSGWAVPARDNAAIASRIAAMQPG